MDDKITLPDIPSSTTNILSGLGLARFPLPCHWLSITANIITSLFSIELSGTWKTYLSFFKLSDFYHESIHSLNCNSRVKIPENVFGPQNLVMYNMMRTLKHRWILNPPLQNIDAGSRCEPEVHSPVTPESNDRSSSKSLTSSVVDFPEENGRTYHGYRPGTYHFPNDVNEQDRLESQFYMLKCAFSDRNYFAPLSDPRYILDIGTGTGQWAIEMGDSFPKAEVQATDLSPIQPVSVPENVHFYIDDASDDDWILPPDHFDYIHTRVLLGCFKDFDNIIKRGFHYTKPGGYMESQEIMFTPYCDDESMPDSWPFLEWTGYVEKAATKAGRSMNVASNLKSWYEAAGFVDVQEKIYKLPINPWSEDENAQKLGEMSEENWLACLSSFSMALFFSNPRLETRTD
ncbi:hypothetical protein EYC84_001089 [Monilinia fructicola]|uniref:Methyltransferase domain-containing protein n=1 Tax=Monilinia fructicola TaxID=38448 RepID=A0A5M9JNW5_MONFR|nr:hypothetical protein EYC84_001089 [Monilinia fructicola]